MNITLSDTSGFNIVDKQFKPQYFVNNELRFVTPYVYTYKLYTKKRWVGKEIKDVLNEEFCAYGKDYFKTSIKKGYIKVNQQNISPDYIMKDNDFIEHKLLLFEKPVLYKKILILYEDENFVCAHKPISMPTHPVGSYQYNSLLRILQNYLNFQKLKKEQNQKEQNQKEQNQKEQNQMEPNQKEKEKNIKDLDLENSEFEDVVKVNFLFNFQETDLKEYEEQMKENLIKRRLRKRSYRERKGTSKKQKNSDEDLNFLYNDLKKKQKNEEEHTLLVDVLRHNQTETEKMLSKEDSVKNINLDEQKTEKEEEEKEKEKEKKNDVFKESLAHLSVNINDKKTKIKEKIYIGEIDITEEKRKNQNVYNAFVDAPEKYGSLNSNNNNVNNSDNDNNNNNNNNNDSFDNYKKVNEKGQEEEKKASEEVHNRETHGETKTQAETERERKNEIKKHNENKNNNENKNGNKDGQGKDAEKQNLNNTSEQLNEGDMYIYTLHRLDKFTSGIALFGKNKTFSTAFAQHLSTNKIKKIYITRVDGDFRLLIKKNLEAKKILKLEEKEKMNDAIEWFCNSENKKPIKFLKTAKCNGNGEDLLKDGQFLYENNYKNESNINEMKMKKLIDTIKTQKKHLQDFFDINKYAEDYFFSEQQIGSGKKCRKEKDTLIKTKEKEKEGKDDVEAEMEEDIKEEMEKEMNEDEYYKYFVVDLGYMYCQSKKTLKYVFVNKKEVNDAQLNKGESNDKGIQNIFTDCDGTADFSLKPTVTKFMFLSYNKRKNESLIICQPITGRTHQIRAHLESLKYPISNDPSYNKNFEKEYLKRSKYLHFINPPHLPDSSHSSSDISTEPSTQHASQEETTKSKKDEAEVDCIQKNSEKYYQFPLIPFLNTSFNWLFDDYINLHTGHEQEFLKNYFFKKIENVTYHSSGIFLHSCRYSWDNVFDVFTLIPNWCASFSIPPKILTFLTYGNLS